MAAEGCMEGQRAALRSEDGLFWDQESGGYFSDTVNGMQQCIIARWRIKNEPEEPCPSDSFFMLIFKSMADVLIAAVRLLKNGR